MDGWIMDNVILLLWLMMIFVVMMMMMIYCTHKPATFTYLPTYLPTSFFEYSYSLPPEYGVKCSYLALIPHTSAYRLHRYVCFV